MKAMRLDERAFAYYEKGEYQFEGMFDEIVERTGMTVQYAKFLASEVASKRRSDIALVPIIDLDTFLCSLRMKPVIVEKLKRVDIYTAEDLVKLSPECLRFLIGNENQFKCVMVYYKYFMKGVEEDESFNNSTITQHEITKYTA